MYSRHSSAHVGAARCVESGTNMMGPIRPNIDQVEISFLIEKNADGIIVVDDTGIVRFVNPAAEKIFGRSSDSLCDLVNR